MFKSGAKCESKFIFGLKLIELGGYGSFVILRVSGLFRSIKKHLKALVEPDKFCPSVYSIRKKFKFLYWCSFNKNWYRFLRIANDCSTSLFPSIKIIYHFLFLRNEFIVEGELFILRTEFAGIHQCWDLRLNSFAEGPVKDCSWGTQHEPGWKTRGLLVQNGTQNIIQMLFNWFRRGWTWQSDDWF